MTKLDILDGVSRIASKTYTSNSFPIPANASSSLVIGYNNINTAINQPEGSCEAEFVNYEDGISSRLATTRAFSFFNVPGISSSIGVPTLPNLIASITRGGDYTKASDRRIKSDILGLEYGLKEIMELKPVSYKRHSDLKFVDGQITYTDKGSHSIGFIAQEVYKVIPEAVTKPVDETKDIWLLGDSIIIPVLVKATQEKQEEIKALKEQVKILSAQAEALMNKIKQ